MSTDSTQPTAIVTLTLDPASLDRLADLVAERLASRRSTRAEHEPLLTVAQAAERAGCHAETIRRAARSGALPASRVGRAVRIDPADLAEWLSEPHGARQTPVRRPRAARPRGRRNPMRDALARLE
jgi:excisionase family DNA binding protein